MRIVLTAEQLELRDMLRHVLADACPPSVVRAAKGGEPADEPWRALAKHGLFGLAVPAEYGGDGAGLFELGLLFEEAGRVLCPTAVYSTLIAALGIERLATPEQRARYLPALAAGDLHATTALWDAADAGDLRPSFTATPHGSVRSLVGATMFVPNAIGADLVLVSARGPADETVVALVEPGAAGWAATPLTTLARDPQARVELAGCSAETVTARTDDLRWVAESALALQCMEMVGGATAVLERTVAHVKAREQFGRALGSFQAVHHHVANMRIALDLARLSAWQATWRLGHGVPATRAVAIAKMHCSDAYKSITWTAHQLHGGMGFVRETDLHLWSERAKVAEIQGGDADVAARWLEHELGL